MADSNPFDAYMSSHMMPSAGLASATQQQKLWCLEATTTQAPDAISAHPSLFASGGTNNTFDDRVAIALASMAAGGSGDSGYPFYAGTVGEYPPAQGSMKSEEEFTGVRIGLNLGHRIYFPMVRRNAPRCQVEGCINADLSAAKLYHKRHKVCDYHSKATIVEAGGSLQRFCQQCSRRFSVLQCMRGSFFPHGETRSRNACSNGNSYGSFALVPPYIEGFMGSPSSTRPRGAAESAWPTTTAGGGNLSRRPPQQPMIPQLP